jgi:beta-galactosidase
VFAFDDYHAEEDGTVGIREPLPGVAYMLAEAVGQFNYTARKGFDAKYVRTGDPALLQAQAVRHAQAHDRAGAYPRCSGVSAWCTFDYSSLINAHHAIKTPGVADVFRIPKPGAAFYQSQVSPKVQPVIQPAFCWDFSVQTANGPGKNAAIFSNCDRLEVFIGDKHIATAQPDHAGYPHLAYPPFFCNLTADGSAHPELRIDGYVDGKLALTRSFSSDASQDQFLLHADDAQLIGDGADATRLVFQVADRFGAPRPFAGAEVHFEISGPGTLVGDNPFNLTASAEWALSGSRRARAPRAGLK